MKKTWEQEKAYYAKRAQEAVAEMKQAISTADKARFEKAYQVALRYMTQKERRPYYIQFLSVMAERSVK